MAYLIAPGIRFSNHSTERTHGRSWVKARYIENQNLLLSNTSPEGFGGLDTMLLMAWIVNKFPHTANEQPFVLYYWDLRMSNILVDKDYSVVTYRSEFSDYNIK